MKLLGALCGGALVALVALCGGVTTPPPSTDCQLSSSEYWTAWRKVESCAQSGSTPAMSKELRKTRDLEPLREIFNGYCQRTTTVRDCLADQTSRYEFCPNEKLLKIFNVHRHQLENVLDVVCAEGRGRLGTLWYGMSQLFDYGTTPLNEEVTKCAQVPMLAMETVDRNQVDLSSAIFILHQQVSEFKECVSQVNLDPKFREVADLVMDNIIRASKCVHPQDGSLVPCSEIDAALVTSPTLCSAKSVGGIPVYDALENDAAKCYGEGVALFVRDYDAPTADTNGLRDDFKTYCLRTLNSSQCLNKSSTFSEMCLNDTQRGEFVVLRASMHSALESACSDGGKRLADVMIEIHRLKKDSAGQADPLAECIDVVKASRKVVSSLPRNRRFYSELDAFKGCFVEKLSANMPSVDSATTVIDEMRRKASCLAPEDGTTLLCETLVTNT